MLLLSLFFGEGRSGVLSNLLVVVVFAAVAVVLWLVLREADRNPRLTGRLDKLEGGTVQIRIRLALLILAVFLVLSQRFGLESILGAFVGGVVLGDLRRNDREEGTSGFWPKVDAIGFGFLIPVYFVTSGVRFNLDGLLHDAGALARVPMFLALFLWREACRPWCSAASSGHGRPARSRLLSATSLSFVITATDIGVRIGKLRDINATAIVGAAVLAMLIFPLGAGALLPRRSDDVRPAEA